MDTKQVCKEECGELRYPGYYKHGGHLPGMMPDPALLPNGQRRYIQKLLGWARADIHEKKAEAFLRLNEYQLVMLCKNPNHIVGHVIEYRRQFYSHSLILEIYPEVLILKDENDRKLLVERIKEQADKAMPQIDFSLS